MLGQKHLKWQRLVRDFVGPLHELTVWLARERKVLLRSGIRALEPRWHTARRGNPQQRRCSADHTNRIIGKFVICGFLSGVVAEGPSPIVTVATGSQGVATIPESH